MGERLSEADLWDEFWDTDAANCCSCPSCNFYALDYEQHKDEPCLLATLIERIIAARLAACADRLAGKVRALVDEWERRAAEVARDYGLVAQWAAYLSRCAELRALLDAEPVPDRPPLRDRVEAVLRAGMNGNLTDALVEAIESGELGP